MAETVQINQTEKAVILLALDQLTKSIIAGPRPDTNQLGSIVLLKNKIQCAEVPTTAPTRSILDSADTNTTYLRSFTRTNGGVAADPLTPTP